MDPGAHARVIRSKLGRILRRDVLLHVEYRQFDEVGVGEVDPGECDDAVCDAEQVEDGQVFLGLRHPALIGRNDEQGDVESSNAGKHVFDEPLVPGDVDEADRLVTDQGPGEAEVDGEASLLLLGPAIRIPAGESLHEGGLAVVDMTGRSDDRHQMAASAEATIESSSGWTDRRFTSAAPSRRAATTGGAWSVSARQARSSLPVRRRTGVGIVSPGTEPAPGRAAPSTIVPTAPTVAKMPSIRL